MTGFNTNAVSRRNRQRPGRVRGPGERVTYPMVRVGGVGDGTWFRAPVLHAANGHSVCGGRSGKNQIILYAVALGEDDNATSHCDR